MDRTTRRSFIVQGTAFVGVLATPKATLAGAADADLITRMTWFNEPAASKRVGEKLVVHCRPKTDFWRKTFYGYITDNGHFLHLQADGDFIFEARVNGRYAALYDQAGLMVRVNAGKWMKCGPEFFHGKGPASPVFTPEFSDRPTIPHLAQP